jgi:hypothetical protein
MGHGAKGMGSFEFGMRNAEKGKINKRFQGFRNLGIKGND